MAAFRAGLISDWPEMLKVSKELREQCERRRLQQLIHEADFFIAWAELKLGEESANIDKMRESLGLLSSGKPIWPFFQSALASAEAAAGNLQAAEDLFAGAIALVETFNERWYEAEIIRQRAEVRLLKDKAQYEGVEEDFRTAIDLARRQGANFWLRRASDGLARLLSSDRPRYQSQKPLPPSQNHQRPT
jgi:predicted ATPase